VYGAGRASSIETEGKQAWSLGQRAGLDGCPRPFRMRGVLGTDTDEPQKPAPSASASTVTTPPAPPATDLPVTPSAGATASGAPNGVPSDLGAPATRAGTADHQKATLAVYPIRRSDTLAVMHFTVTVDPLGQRRHIRLRLIH
jgi:hypothetical protein